MAVLSGTGPENASSGFPPEMWPRVLYPVADFCNGGWLLSKVTPSPQTLHSKTEQNGKIKEKSHKMHTMGAWRSCPHPCMSKSTECSNCQGNLPLPTAHTHLHLLAFWRRSSSPTPSLDLKSGPILSLDLPIPTRLFLTLIKTHQLNVLYLLHILLHYSILTPWREPFHPALGPTLPLCHGRSWRWCFHHFPWSRDLTPPETTQGHGSCW